MAREKTVFPTDKIAGIWLWGTINYARNPQDNFYFRGNTIYSYGTHFPIARKLEDGKILFTLDTHSKTTAKHLHQVRYAVRNKEVIYCMNFDSHTLSLEHWYDMIEKKIDEIRVRANRKFEDRVFELKLHAKRLKTYADYFKIELPFKRIVELNFILENDMATIVKELRS